MEVGDEKEVRATGIELGLTPLPGRVGLLRMAEMNRDLY